MSRDIGYYWSRIVIYTLVALCVGTLFYDVGTSYTAILARGACGGFVTGYMTFMSIGGFPSFVEEMKVHCYFSFIFFLPKRRSKSGVDSFFLSTNRCFIARG